MSLSLYTHAAELQQWAEALAAIEGTPEWDESAELRAEIQEGFHDQIAATADKVDRFNQFLDHLAAIELQADAEIQRLRERKAQLTRVRKRLMEYAVRTMEVTRQRRLEGNLSTIRLRANPASVEVTDERAVPAAFRIATIKVNYGAWLAHLERHDTLREMFADSIGAPKVPSTFPALCTVTTEVSKSAVAVEIKAGREVPGCDLKVGEQRLVRE